VVAGVGMKPHNLYLSFTERRVCNCKFPKSCAGGEPGSPPSPLLLFQSSTVQQRPPGPSESPASGNQVPREPGQLNRELRKKKKKRFYLFAAEYKPKWGFKRLVGPSGAEWLVISALHAHKTNEKGKHKSTNVMIGAE